MPAKSRDAANRAEQNRLDQELQQDVHAARADRHPDADLAGALGNRDQQDVHDADAADQQRNRCDRGEQQRHHMAAALGRFRDLAQVADIEIVVLARLNMMPPMEVSVICWIASGSCSSLRASAKITCTTPVILGGAPKGLMTVVLPL